MNMKNSNKITKYFIILFWFRISWSIIKAEVIITELFILQADGTHTPQYIELYNNSDTTVSLEGWSIHILDNLENIINPDFAPVFTVDNPFCTVNSTDIDAFGYFLISTVYCVDSGCGGSEFYYEDEEPSDIIADWLYLPLDGKGSVILINDAKDTIDSVRYNIDDERWERLLNVDSKGHSLRLDVAPTNSDDNDDPDNWSLSPETEKSIWLYDEGEEIKSFGSPGEENSFKLQNIHYSDFWFSNIEIDTGGTHAIYGDVNDFYRAEPYEDFGIDKLPDTGDEGEGNGIWDFDEEYHDRNLNNIWDHQDNNYDSLLTYSWHGTSSSWLSKDELISSNYEIIIEKKVTSLDSISLLLYNTGAIKSIDTIRISNNTDTTMFISPSELLIDSLGRYREIAEYTWTVELTKTFTDTVDIIYSDKYTFFIDASDYGQYGCVDNGSCVDDGNCPTNAYYESSYISNHPTGCTPESDDREGGCYSALNYYDNANINSNTCHYVSLSMPAFVIGDTSAIVTVPVYLYNDSLANIDTISYTLSFDNNSEIISYYEDEDASPFSGTILSGLGNDNIIYNDSTDILVNMENISIDGAGIITNLAFKLIGSQSDTMGLTFSSPIIIGGDPENNIQVPVKEGQILILQTNYVIAGQVYYYLSDGVENPKVANVELKLNKNNNEINYFDTTTYSDINTSAIEPFRFDGLTIGNYKLSFSKSPENEFVNGWDLSYIQKHLMGIEPLSADQSIAADVSLDGTVSGYDVSLIAQYSVGLIDNFNDIHTHWIFKPTDQLNVHSELLEQNGIYSIEYKPLILDDVSRTIFAYRLGEVTGDYSNRSSSRFNRGQVQFTDITIDYRPIITLPIIISEPTFIEGMDIEIGYDEDVFNPLSITFNNSNEIVENYRTILNLFSKDKTIKTVTWAIEDPQIVEGKIGEVSFNWNNKSGKIWLEEFQVNDEPVVGGISLIGWSGNDVVDGVNIINSPIPVELSLHQNYPNPFNPQTIIKWSMPSSGMVTLEVYNLQGQLVELLFNGQLEAGIHEQTWDAATYSSGIYFYRMTTNKKTLQKVMLLVK